MQLLQVRVEIRVGEHVHHPTLLDHVVAVGQGLVKFKPGTTEWENDAAADIKQVDDKTIEFTLKDGLKFSGDYGPVTAEDVKYSFERFLKPGANGKKVVYADDWAALDSVEVTGPLTGKIHLKNPSPAVWLIALADDSGVIVSRKAMSSPFASLMPMFRAAAPPFLFSCRRYTMRSSPYCQTFSAVLSVKPSSTIISS